MQFDWHLRPRFAAVLIVVAIALSFLVAWWAALLVIPFLIAMYAWFQSSDW